MSRESREKPFLAESCAMWGIQGPQEFSRARV